jgi:hypothetical protein
MIEEAAVTHYGAGWRMPSRQEIEEAERRRRPDPEKKSSSADDGWWDAALGRSARRRPAGNPIQARRLAEIPREVLRVECLRRFPVVEIRLPGCAQALRAARGGKDVRVGLPADGLRASHRAS